MPQLSKTHLCNTCSKSPSCEQPPNQDNGAVCAYCKQYDEKSQPSNQDFIRSLTEDEMRELY